jgi:triacylglycerol lipase
MLMSVVQIHLSPPKLIPKPLTVAWGFSFVCAAFVPSWMRGPRKTELSKASSMTNARIQQFLVVSSLAFWWLLAAWLWPEPRWLALLCVLMPLLITPSLIALQCLLAARANRHDEAPRLSMVSWLRVWLAEWAVCVRVFSWWQPFFRQAEPDLLNTESTHRGLVLVHGFFCNRALWTPWLRLLRAQGRAVLAVDLEPAFGSISRYAELVEQAVVKIERATGKPPVLVGHSMGGLAIRAWAQRFAASPAGLQRVHHIFTIGTPHHGTEIAELSHTRNGQEMRRGSPWLKANVSALPDGFAKSCTCFYSNGDNIVFPATTATWPGADNRLVAARGHVELAFVPEVMHACMQK